MASRDLWALGVPLLAFARYKHRVASFVKREKATMNKIESLEKRLLEGAENDEHSKRMEAIGNMHRSVITGLECIQTNTAKILQDMRHKWP